MENKSADKKVEAIVTKINSLGMAHSASEVFSDLLELLACSLENYPLNILPLEDAISHIRKVNPEDGERKVKRFKANEEKHQNILKKYNDAEQKLLSDLFSEIIDFFALEGYSDLLGEVYMRLNIAKRGLGQTFTPFSVATLLAKMCINPEELKAQLATDNLCDGSISYNDPCCGSGCLSIATMAAIADTCEEFGIPNYKSKIVFYLQDLDFTAVQMAFIQMSLLDIPAVIVHGSTLTEPITSDLDIEADNVYLTPIVRGYPFREVVIAASAI